MQEEKEVWGAYLLWFFAGFLGFHKFYLNKIGMGISYIFTAMGSSLHLTFEQSAFET